MQLTETMDLSVIAELSGCCESSWQRQVGLRDRFFLHDVQSGMQLQHPSTLLEVSFGPGCVKTPAHEFSRRVRFQRRCKSALRSARERAPLSDCAQALGGF